MTTLIEAAVTLADVAKALRSTATAVEADARALDMFVGHAWDGRPALDVRDAAALVSGDARRDHDHAAAHARWRADSEAWADKRESERRRAFTDHFDAARRRGVGDPQASSEAAQVASAAVEAYERKTPAPAFGDVVASRLSQVKSRVKESVLR